MSREEKRTPRAQRKVDKQAASDQKRYSLSTTDALCTECGEWYDASKASEVRRHAH